MKKHLLETLRWILVLPLSGVVLFGAYQLVLMTHWVFFFINNAFFNWIVELFAGSIGSVAFIYTGLHVRQVSPCWLKVPYRKVH